MRDLLLGGLTRIARLSVGAIVGLALLIFAVAPPIGAVYVWLTTGLSPLAQVREEGTLAAFVMWPIVGLAFTPIHVLGAFVEGGAEARVAVAAITGCLAALWVLALHRGRALRAHARAGHHPTLAVRASGVSRVKITLSSIVVNDQARARRFYVERLGFVIKADLPMGEYGG